MTRTAKWGRLALFGLGYTFGAIQQARADRQPPRGGLTLYSPEMQAVRDAREPRKCPRCGQMCHYDGWDHVHANGIGIGSCAEESSSACPCSPEPCAFGVGQGGAYFPDWDAGLREELR